MGKKRWGKWSLFVQVAAPRGEAPHNSQGNGRYDLDRLDNGDRKFGNHNGDDCQRGPAEYSRNGSSSGGQVYYANLNGKLSRTFSL